MQTVLDSWLHRWRAMWLRRQGIRIGAGCVIHPGVCARQVYHRESWGSITIADRATLSRGAVIESWGGEVRIGSAVFVGPYAVIYGHGGVTIGDDTLIAMHCCIVSSNHTIPPRSGYIRAEPDILLPTRIGRDVWLGANVTVLGGTTIGDGCVIGAGAVVTKDLPPYSIAHGVPARVVGTRA